PFHPLSLHDALPICVRLDLFGLLQRWSTDTHAHGGQGVVAVEHERVGPAELRVCILIDREALGPDLLYRVARDPARCLHLLNRLDRKSTRLNSSHGS